MLGAGGAGLICASVAGKSGKSVLVIDHNDEPGRKILISGGGRCNFTNLHVEPGNFLSQNRHFAKSALARFTQHDFLELVEKHAIAWHEKTLGQLFCDGSSKQIVKLLMDECAEGNVTFSLSTKIESVERNGEGFEVATSSGKFHSTSVVVATGGQSIPKLGATDLAYRIARQFKLKVIEPKPALVPFTLDREQTLFKDLSGVATDTVASNDRASFAEASLFTHKGLSGPAILQISSYWNHGEWININFVPDAEEDWLLKAKASTPRSGIKTALGNHLPGRLAEALCNRMGIDDRNLADYTDEALREVEGKLTAWRFKPNGTEGFAKAEVTIGGVSTAELSSQTMGSKKCAGLHFIGECVDVTGWLGGYNFQWAWSSGYVCGQAIAESVH